jgi:ER degradation enhancer, mannosidase alpha-like 1
MHGARRLTSRSALLGDPVFFGVADRAARAVWARRDNSTWLLGSALDAVSGAWLDPMSGVGAGSDSFFEYMLKVRLAR